MKRTMVEYEGRIAIQDADPGSVGDLIMLVDDEAEYARLDSALCDAYGQRDDDGFRHFFWGELEGKYRIVIERIA